MIDPNGGSTVWDDRFAADQDAYDEFYRTLEVNGIRSFLEEQPGSHKTLNECASARQPDAAVAATGGWWDWDEEDDRHGIQTAQCWRSRSLERDKNDAGTVIEKSWSGVTVKWDNRERQTIMHNNMIAVTKA